MDHPFNDIIKEIIQLYNKSGVVWKVTKTKHYGKAHLEKRQRRNDLPQDWTLEDYNNHILNIMKGMDNNVHIYFLPTFKQSYFAFDDGTWIQ
ncbi:hypothetical protein [Ornithinibacillus halophilus]|uniref:Uncharacterized protein n=1 Tax=Ornithinibacillus halophilus TaxID=930117 RepID=A0A1M5NY13_9BACI|nr:hypothetical protein [Ornithinibacillus halophilus]SHG94079.1 hypothetical protein SAMN05216225_10923 [Ornithinibacillus halophilus]